MSKLEIVSSRHDDLSRWGSRTFSLPELIPEVRELGLVGPLVNPESLPVSHRITHNIHITGQCKKRERNEKSACIVQFLNCNCIFPEGSSPLLLFLLFFVFLLLESGNLAPLGSPFPGATPQGGLVGASGDQGRRRLAHNHFILMSFQWLFSVFSFTLLFCNILVHNHLILMYFQKILSILFFLVTITF